MTGRSAFPLPAELLPQVRDQTKSVLSLLPAG